MKFMVLGNDFGFYARERTIEAWWKLTHADEVAG